jgi:hypothetical protein
MLTCLSLCIQTNLYSTTILGTPQKVAVVQKWSLFRGFLNKICIEICLTGLRVAIFGRWPLFRGGRKDRFFMSYHKRISIRIGYFYKFKFLGTSNLANTYLCDGHLSPTEVTMNLTYHWFFSDHTLDRDHVFSGPKGVRCTQN